MEAIISLSSIPVVRALHKAFKSVLLYPTHTMSTIHTSSCGYKVRVICSFIVLSSSDFPNDIGSLEITDGILSPSVKSRLVFHFPRVPIPVSDIRELPYTAA